MATNPTTADLIDDHGDTLRSCSTQFRQYGGREVFSGPVRTVRCHEDNGLVKQILASPGEGAVLVVDGNGSLRSALMGDMIAEIVDGGSLTWWRARRRGASPGPCSTFPVSRPVTARDDKRQRRRVVGWG